MVPADSGVGPSGPKPDDAPTGLTKLGSRLTLEGLMQHIQHPIDQLRGRCILGFIGFAPNYFVAGKPRQVIYLVLQNVRAPPLEFIGA